MVFEFTSYIFGGLVENESGQLVVTNDLIETKTRRITYLPHGNESHSYPTLSMSEIKFI